MGVFGKVKGMVRTAEGTLEVAQERIDCAELRQSNADLSAPGDDALMLGAYDLDGTEAPQSPGDHGGRGRDRAGCEDRHRLVRERLLAQVHELRLPVGCGLHRGDKRDRCPVYAASRPIRLVGRGFSAPNCGRRIARRAEAAPYAAS